MSERGAAPERQDSSPSVGEQPTLAATPEQINSGTRVRDHWIGKEIAGRYVIRERLGEGGMGVVFIAEHLHLKKRVAFKVIHPDLAAHEELLLRFQREALATGQLDHPHIAAAIDFGELADGGAFMVMPLVRGHSLQKELDDRGKMDPRRAARLGSEIADALSAAHAVGIVHRDLKPDNVLLEQRTDGSESAKVLDFGVASLAGRAEGLSVVARPLTQAGTILGTPGYMSPEQASAGEVDHRTDLYALGVMLWELCNGRRLFDGDDITQIFAKQFKSLPPLLELDVRELNTLVARLLAWDKNERPSSASEVRDALRSIAEQRTPSTPVPHFSLWVRRAKPYHKHLYAGLVALLFLIPLLTRKSEPEPVLAPEVTDEKPAAKASAEEPRAPDEPPARLAEAAPLPKVFEEPAKTLLESRNTKERRAVAKRLMRSTGVPPYLSLLAELEVTTRCNERKALIAEMRKQLDPRVLPALERMAEQPRTGCAPFRLGDCLSCLRRDLDQTIGVLQQAHSP
ncbi:MAG TPA: protein kinase [Polyangiales bacterium]|nr:protein kinase [Polyangiales bacterium]